MICDKERRNKHLTRAAVGLKPQMPVMLAGMRMLPPMSLPKPSGDPPQANRAASPPVEPPTPRLESRGWHVAPKIGLDVSQLEGSNCGNDKRSCHNRGQKERSPDHGLRHVRLDEGDSALLLEHLRNTAAINRGARGAGGMPLTRMSTESSWKGQLIHLEQPTVESYPCDRRVTGQGDAS